MRTILLALLIVQTPPVPPQVPQADPNIRGTIQGIVKSSASSEGIPDVEVTLTGVPTAPIAQAGATQGLTKTTDASGRFSFADVPGGRYTIRAQRDGYFPPSNAALPAAAISILGATSAAVITKDAPNAQVTVNLVPGGVISGQVRDQQGRPAAGVPLVVLRAAYQDGRRTLQVVSTTTGFSGANSNHTTSDRGDYRIFWLPPGEYFVRTDTQNNVAASLRATSSSTVPQVTYYPGTTDVSRAVAVKVHPGEEVAAIDFTVEYARAFSASGKVTVAVPVGRTFDGQLRRSISSFFVVSQNADPGERVPLTPGRSTTSDQVEFDFEVRGLAPGAYYLFPLFADQQSATAPRATYSSTRIPVEIIDRDVTGLRGIIKPNADLTARVTLKGDLPAGVRSPATPPRIQLRPQEALGSLIATPSILNTQVNADGTMIFPNLFPTRYKIQVPTPAGYYLADIRRGSANLYDDAILTVTPEDTDVLEIMFSTGGGEIRGIVRDRESKPTAATVILIPQAPRRANSLLYKRSAANAMTGEFILADIAPGEYKVFAWQINPNSAEENAEYLAKYEGRGRSITINAGVKIGDVALDIINNEAP